MKKVLRIMERWQPRHPLVWVLFNVLMLGLLAILAIWVFVPASFTMLTGQHVQGMVFLIKDCGTDDNGNTTYEQTFLYKDALGQLQESTTGADCFNEDSNSAVASAWYLQRIPGSVIMDDGSPIFYLIFGALDLVGMLVSLVSLACCLWTLIISSQQQKSFTRLLLAGLGCLVTATWLLVMLHYWPPPAEQDGNGPTHNFPIGQVVIAEQRWAVTIQGGQEGLLHAPDAGQQCLNLTMTLRNVTSQTLAFQASQFTLYDAQIKPVSATCPSDTPMLGNATLRPGATLTATNVYEVPASMRQFYLAFRPNPQGEENVGRYFWNVQTSRATDRRLDHQQKYTEPGNSATSIS
jgi:hypothetical protein